MTLASRLWLRAAFGGRMPERMLRGMGLWIVLALLTGAAVLTVLWPLSNTAVAATRGSDDDVRFYRAQLAEIEGDAARGLLLPAEADAARIESSRRLIRAAERPADREETASEPALRRRRAASALALATIPIVSLGVYGTFGSPQLPAYQAEKASSGVESSTLAAALTQIEAHLGSHPDDKRGWDIVAPVYLRTARYQDAARAYGEAMRVGGETVERLVGQGEALVGAAGGIVTAGSRAVFERALRLDRNSQPVRYYLALAAEQEGETGQAISQYQALLSDAPPNAPWVGPVKQRLDRLNATSLTDTPRKVEVTPEIKAMVDGLDERLKASGGTAAEWSRLVRSYVVLGRRDDALERLGRARIALAGDQAALTGLDSVASELGLSGAASR